MLEKLIQEITDLTLSSIANEWKAQGHNLSGAAIKAMELQSKFVINTLILEGYMVDYMAINNEGVKPERIPYYPRSGRKTSKYIDGLIDYVKKRMGKSDKEAKSIAFAIASKHKKEGMPTKSSSKYSKTGRRTGFIETTLNKISPQIVEIIEKEILYSVEVEVMSFYKSQLNR